MFLINSRKKIAEFSYASIKGETELRNKLIIDTLYISKKIYTQLLKKKVKIEDWNSAMKQQ